MFSTFILSTSYNLRATVILEHTPNETMGRVVKLDRLAALLGGAAPVIAYAGDGSGRVVFPADPEGDHLARCLAAQLTLCAAGLWPA